MSWALKKKFLLLDKVLQIPEPYGISPMGTKESAAFMPDILIYQNVQVTRHQEGVPV